jgi:hypothetical protein
MASDPVHGPATLSTPYAGSGNVAPVVANPTIPRISPAGSSGGAAAAGSSGGAAAAASATAEPQALVAQLNKLLNDSGLPDQFRLDPAGKLIQQINPATGAVVGELPASEFPALARTVGASGLLLDSLA